MKCKNLNYISSSSWLNKKGESLKMQTKMSFGFSNEM
jgi:hypothetical protein